MIARYTIVQLVAFIFLVTQVTPSYAGLQGDDVKKILQHLAKLEEKCQIIFDVLEGV